MSRKQIHVRVRRAQLHRLHPGVYAVGHPRLTFRGRLWAAVLACGGPEHAAVSHWSSAAVFDLASGAGRSVHVSTTRNCRSRPGLRVHRRREPIESTLEEDGLPVATPSQTIVDLAPLLSAVRLEQLVHRAEQRRLLDARALQRALDHRPPGAAKLRAVLAQLTEPQLARNDFEIAFLEIVARYELPEPEVNAHIGPYSPDFLWRDARLIVELDGAETHLTRKAFEHDRRRDVFLQLAGYRVLRFTWRQLTDEPGYVAGAVRSSASQNRVTSSSVV